MNAQLDYQLVKRLAGWKMGAGTLPCSLPCARKSTKCRDLPRVLFHSHTKVRARSLPSKLALILRPCAGVTSEETSKRIRFNGKLINITV